MAAKKDKVRQEAEAYYIQNYEATQQEVAELYKVTQKTISSWCIKYDWEQGRTDFHSSPFIIMRVLQQEAISISRGKPPKINADAMSKIVSSIDKLSNKSNPAVVAKLLKELDNFISEEDPNFALKATHFHKKFLQHRINLELQ